ncbi:hypothetical protein M0G74_04170 [Microbulbifer sp. CAU 1566]|uniref:hypothetical protein n=1 Tax=Microbulbifer sp. CAU 1566 TaxID=2933269 RepID=UPI00200557B7|nr:hypothetical protein [Microbulbifer sp. CAU 1566]MCK7596465.1 hypothetical protein [Microbulbifer sp. CAU 1566]
MKSSTVHPVDALKSLDEILVADPRNKHIDIAYWHEKIAEITLSRETPIDVQQIFENAKNIALYTYFSYRLHQPAEAVAYTALELALKLKYKNEKIEAVRTPRSLAEYMDIALEQGWITDEGYKSSRNIAIHRIQSQKIHSILKEVPTENRGPFSIPTPKECEIIAEMRSMGIAKTRLHAGRHVRNFLAHGDTGLSPSSIRTLANIAEEINQLFG